MSRSQGVEKIPKWKQLQRLRRMTKANWKMVFMTQEGGPGEKETAPMMEKERWERREREKDEKGEKERKMRKERKNVLSILCHRLTFHNPISILTL